MVVAAVRLLAAGRTRRDPPFHLRFQPPHRVRGKVAARREASLLFQAPERRPRQPSPRAHFSTSEDSNGRAQTLRIPVARVRFGAVSAQRTRQSHGGSDLSKREDPGTGRQTVVASGGAFIFPRVPRSYPQSPRGGLPRVDRRESGLGCAKIRGGGCAVGRVRPPVGHRGPAVARRSCPLRSLVPRSQPLTPTWCTLDSEPTERRPDGL